MVIHRRQSKKHALKQSLALIEHRTDMFVLQMRRYRHMTNQPFFLEFRKFLQRSFLGATRQIWQASWPAPDPMSRWA